jgi:hypothetical protein
MAISIKNLAILLGIDEKPDIFVDIHFFKGKVYRKLRDGVLICSDLGGVQ